MSQAILSFLEGWWARWFHRAGGIRTEFEDFAPSPASAGTPPEVAKAVEAFDLREAEQSFLETVRIDPSKPAAKAPYVAAPKVRDSTLAALEHLKQIPALQSLVQGVNQIMGRDGVTVDEVVAALEKDSALCVRILTMANSVAIASEQRIVDLQTAVQMLGIARVRRVAQAVFTLRGAQQMAEGLDWRHLWIHALATAAVAEELDRRTSSETSPQIYMAGLLHDVGKIGIRDNVLSKPGHLTDEEFAVMKSHPAVGEGILKPVPQLAEVIPGVVSHHERYDGKGYPRGLKGDDIPMMGRIIGVADAFDAMTSDRVYRPRLSDEVALGELRKHSGTQFDSRVVKAFLSAYDKGLIVTEPGNSNGNGA